MWAHKHKRQLCGREAPRQRSTWQGCAARAQQCTCGKADARSGAAAEEELCVEELCVAPAPPSPSPELGTRRAPRARRFCDTLCRNARCAARARHGAEERGVRFAAALLCPTTPAAPHHAPRLSAKLRIALSVELGLHAVVLSVTAAWRRRPVSGRAEAAAAPRTSAATAEKEGIVQHGRAAQQRRRELGEACRLYRNGRAAEQKYETQIGRVSDWTCALRVV